jgi:16S rRNA (uracil1498-N3)-methyltransferase
MPQEIIRIFVDQTISGVNQEFIIKEQKGHHLANVMRLKEGDNIIIFNGIDGDWLSQISHIRKEKITLLTREKINSQNKFKRKISLAFCLPKRSVLKDIAKQATELGVFKFYPIVSKRSFIGDFNKKSFLTNIIEACQQCKRNNIPQIVDKKSLIDFVRNINEEQNLIICDESGRGKSIKDIIPSIDYNKENIILIGPEGGFSSEEFHFMDEKNLIKMDLGENVLRVSTACVAAISVINLSF